MPDPNLPPYGFPLRFLTDDRDIPVNEQHELIIQQGGNGDWYVSVVPKGERAFRAVRICTSGGAARSVPGLGVGIANAYRAMRSAASPVPIHPSWCARATDPFGLCGCGADKLRSVSPTPLMCEVPTCRTTTAETDVATMEAAGWRHDDEHGWRCPDHDSVTKSIENIMRAIDPMGAMISELETLPAYSRDYRGDEYVDRNGDRVRLDDLRRIIEKYRGTSQ